MSSSSRRRLAACLAVLPLALSACQAATEPPSGPCDPAPVAAAPAPTPAPAPVATPQPPTGPPPTSAQLAPTTPEALSEADRLLPGYSALRTATPEARLALDATLDLFAGRYEQVHALFDPSLAATLPPGELGAIIRGVVAHHGPPGLVMDAWLSRIDDEEDDMPAAKVLLRMSRSDVRFRLLMVFNPDRSVRGLWLRPL